MRALLLHLTLTSVLFGSINAHAASCTPITSVPVNLTESGFYCLTQNLRIESTPGAAISVNADNVSIDLNGYRLEGPITDLGQSKGIYAVKRRNLTIRNGAISGFQYAIWLNDNAPYADSKNHIVEHLSLENNLTTAIWVIGTNSIVRHNRISRTGTPTSSYTYGILARGHGARIVGNDLSDLMVTPGATTHAIHLLAGSSSTVSDNQVSGVGASGESVGIYIENSSTTLVRNNTLSGVASGIIFDGKSQGKYIGNITVGVGRSYSGGEAVGNNF